MGAFSWLHFSDLHLELNEKFSTQYARKRLLGFLSAETAAGRLPYDYIFITGDVANRGVYRGVPAFAKQLFEALGATDLSKVFWAAGNHDIPRKSRLRELVISHIRSSKRSEELFEELMNDPETRDVLLSKVIKDYARNHNKILGKQAFDIRHPSNPHVKYLLPDLNLIVLNTCLTSCDDNDDRNLFIRGGGLLSMFEGLDSGKPTFVIGHHGIEYFRQGEQDVLGSLFDSGGVDMYLCGHSHRLGYSDFPEASRTIHQITCGGGAVKNPYKISFIHGQYDDGQSYSGDGDGSRSGGSVILKPYSYAENGNREWQFDGSLHRKLNGRNKLELTGCPAPSAPSHGRA